jgi:uncharacterized coiled-coil DUF342 family protein
MDTRKAYQDKIESQLNEWSKQLEAWKAKAENKAADVKVAFSEEINKMLDKHRTLKEKVMALKDATDEKWEELKSAVEKVVEEMKSWFQTNKEWDKDKDKGQSRTGAGTNPTNPERKPQSPGNVPRSW